jgi:hypothetical protein
MAGLYAALPGRDSLYAADAVGGSRTLEAMTADLVARAQPFATLEVGPSFRLYAQSRVWRVEG